MNFTIPILALISQIAAFFYLRSWRPIVTFAKAYQLKRQIQAYRAAGLL